MNKDLEEKERNVLAGKKTSNNVEVFDPTLNSSPFISFHYSNKEISSDGVNTNIRSKKKSFENGKFKSEDFEGTLPGSVYFNMVGEMQKLFSNQIKEFMKPFSMFLPSGSKIKDE